jgi:adenosine deaminase
LIDSIEILRKKYFLEREFLPELCLDRQKAVDEQYQQWFYDLIQSEYFKMLDLTGDELAPLDPIIPMFRAAEKRGLTLKAHVAEYSNSIVAMETAKCLHLTQIQHGNVLAEDMEAIKWLCNSGIQLNMCPSSNYYLSRIDSIANHPIKKLFRNNVKVTINSDDALIFGRTVTDEYIELYKNHVLNAEELNQIRINGLE